MNMEKTISGHLSIPRDEWDARQRADTILGRGAGMATAFTIHGWETAKASQATGHGASAASSSHGNVPPVLQEPPPPARPASPPPAMPAMGSDGRPEKTLNDWLRMRMADRARELGISDEDWDEDYILTHMKSCME